MCFALEMYSYLCLPYLYTVFCLCHRWRCVEPVGGHEATTSKRTTEGGEYATERKGLILLSFFP